MTWRGTAHPFALKPSWLEMVDTPWPEVWRRLQRPDFQQQLIDEPSVYVGDFERFVTESWHKMFPMASGYEPAPGQSVAAEAQRRGVSPAQIAMEHLMAAEDAMLYFPLFNYSEGNLDALHALHTSPHTLMGLSDAGAHCGAICDGGMPTFMLTHWARDRQTSIPLQQIIHRQTQATARAIGLTDRGVIAPGYRADINLIDLERLRLRRPEMRFDLPAGGRRLIQRAEGYVMTLCRGEPIVVDDTLTHARPGGLLRVQMTH
jgi:N-acyl-D-aspartate/D-glutamate deacylase